MRLTDVINTIYGGRYPECEEILIKKYGLEYEDSFSKLADICYDCQRKWLDER